MSKNWPTKQHDMHLAVQIMEKYASAQQTDSLGLFELVLHAKEKRVDVQLSDWVRALVHCFEMRYGVIKGHLITRQVVTHCLTGEQTIH